MSNFFDRQNVYGTMRWRRMRREILKAADYRCAICHERHSSRFLELHHVIPLADAPELAFDISNLMLTCRTCHRRQHGPPSWMTRAKTDHRQRWLSELNEAIS